MPKANAIPAARELLPTIDLQGRVVTADALHCQRETARYIIDSGGHYLFVVKDNQADLRGALIAEFAPLFPPASELARQAELEVFETSNKGHGRRERRVLESATRLARHVDWPGLAQVCRLTCTAWRGATCSVEMHYAVTSARRSEANASQLLQWRRGHWLIENRLHWIRDVVWGEDGCRIRTGNLPQTMSCLRNGVLNLLRTRGITQISATPRESAYRVDLLFARLGVMKL